MDLKDPPDIPPSFPLKAKGPSELPSWPLMHGAGDGGAAKSPGEQKASKPLGKPKGVPGSDPNLCRQGWGAPLLRWLAAGVVSPGVSPCGDSGGAWGRRGLGCSRHGGDQKVLGVQGWECRMVQGV